MDDTDRPQEHQPEGDFTFREPKRPSFLGGGTISESLRELVESCLNELSGEELTPNWRKRLEIDDYEIGRPVSPTRQARPSSQSGEAPAA